MGPTPPSNHEVEEVIRLRVSSRSGYRSNSISWVESIELTHEDGTTIQAFIKTTRPILTHEPIVYQLLEGYDVSSAKLIGSGCTSNDDPWIVVTAVSHSGELPVSEISVCQALRGLAAVHSRYYRSEEDLNGVPRWDIAWLASEASHTCETLLGHAALNGTRDLSEDLLSTYHKCLGELAGKADLLHPTLVHGDFDPGNLICQPNGSITVLDWGLSHISTPLIDLAHMVERFDEPTRFRLVADYFDSVAFDLNLPERNAIRFGGVIHRAFFVWWHTTLIAEGWETFANYGHVIGERVRYVVTHACLDN